MLATIATGGLAATATGFVGTTAQLGNTGLKIYDGYQAINSAISARENFNDGNYISATFDVLNVGLNSLAFGRSASIGKQKRIVPQQGLGLTDLSGGSTVKVATKATQSITKPSLKRLKRAITNLSKPERPGLSQQKLNQLRRIANKANGKVRVDLYGVKGTGVRPHAHVEGLGGKVQSRHIWLQEGVK